MKDSKESTARPEPLRQYVIVGVTTIRVAAHDKSDAANRTMEPERIGRWTVPKLVHVVEVGGEDIEGVVKPGTMTARETQLEREVASLRESLGTAWHSRDLIAEECTRLRKGRAKP